MKQTIDINRSFIDVCNNFNLSADELIKNFMNAVVINNNIDFNFIEIVKPCNEEIEAMEIYDNDPNPTFISAENFDWGL